MRIWKQYIPVARWCLCYGISLLLWIHPCLAQDTAAPVKWKFSLRDSLDHAIDFSDWILNAGGFVPVPYIITEPAVGFGGAIVPVFLHKHKQPQLVNRPKHAVAIPPDVTGALAFYTASKSWGAGAFRTATIVPWQLRYTVMAAYFDMNLHYYKTLPRLGEVKYGTSLKMIPLFLRVQKQIGWQGFSAGAQYIFTKTEATLTDHVLPDSLFKPREFDNISSIAGILAEFDNRDNIFTPNKGYKAHLEANLSASALGSDFDYTHLNGFAYAYIPFGHAGKWVCGLRADMQQIFGDIPFYYKPSIDLRGIPRGRYQGDANILVETEQRWNMFHRWSAVFFGGTGKAFDDYSDFGSAKWVYNGGAGIRYLLARKFKLYMGVDVARGPEQWGAYIQFGSAWMK